LVIKFHEGGKLNYLSVREKEMEWLCPGCHKKLKGASGSGSEEEVVKYCSVVLKCKCEV
jgi:hypothetical protein